jgi:hypothetical protein
METTSQMQLTSVMQGQSVASFSYLYWVVKSFESYTTKKTQ